MLDDACRNASQGLLGYWGCLIIRSGAEAGGAFLVGCPSHLIWKCSIQAPLLWLGLFLSQPQSRQSYCTHKLLAAISSSKRDLPTKRLVELPQASVIASLGSQSSPRPASPSPSADRHLRTAALRRCDGAAAAGRAGAPSRGGMDRWGIRGQPLAVSLRAVSQPGMARNVVLAVGLAVALATAEVDARHRHAHPADHPPVRCPSRDCLSEVKPTQLGKSCRAGKYHMPPPHMLCRCMSCVSLAVWTSVDVRLSHQQHRTSNNPPRNPPHVR